MSRFHTRKTVENIAQNIRHKINIMIFTSEYLLKYKFNITDTIIFLLLILILILQLLEILQIFSFRKTKTEDRYKIVPVLTEHYSITTVSDGK
jgi:hypothetical protein